MFSIDEHGVALIAPVPSGLPTPIAPALDGITRLLPGAFAIAIMCFLETASVAGTVRRPDEPAIDNDQELAANGLSCIGGAFFRALPSAGGFSQTAINQQQGTPRGVSVRERQRAARGELIERWSAFDLCPLHPVGVLEVTGLDTHRAGKELSPPSDVLGVQFGN